MEAAELFEIVQRACRDLQRMDGHLLEQELHERTLTARLAHHLQKGLGRSYFVDCEYNKMADGSGIDIPKRLVNWPSKTGRVLPDIIVHQRTSQVSGNLAVIEAKWKPEERDTECEKIRAYMTEEKLKYQHGYFLLFGPVVSVESVTTVKSEEF
jgi:hypothetical protein